MRLWSYQESNHKKTWCDHLWGSGELDPFDSKENLLLFVKLLLSSFVSFCKWSPQQKKAGQPFSKKEIGRERHKTYLVVKWHQYISTSLHSISWSWNMSWNILYNWLNNSKKKNNFKGQKSYFINITEIQSMVNSYQSACG